MGGRSRWKRPFDFPIPRLQFSDQAVVLAPGINSEPVGLLTISADTPAVNQLLSVSALGITDADNN